MRYSLWVMFCFYWNLGFSSTGHTTKISSPDGQIGLVVDSKGGVRYSVVYGEDTLMRNNEIGLQLRSYSLDGLSKLLKTTKNTQKQALYPIVPLKYAKVNDEYNEVILHFQQGFQIQFRAYNDGVAYRIKTQLKADTVEVMEEKFQIDFAPGYQLHIQQPEGFKTAYEESYTHISGHDWEKKGQGTMAVLPLLASFIDKPYKVLFSETDVYDYPAMFVKPNGKGSIMSVFPKVPLTFDEDGDRSVKIVTEANYIAKTTANRNYPWRYFVITKDDRQLVQNTMNYRLSEKNILQEVNWIKPGKASWEWWNGAIVYGEDVHFKSGFNKETYKYYIDFAAKHGLEYIIMDEGWAKSTTDPFTPNPDVDVKEIIAYGKERNVGVFLWLTWLSVEKNMDLFARFSEWGVKGVKIDFMDRSDQWMVNFYERVAREAAKHQLLVDFHGSFKPSGLEYKYPNVISYEGVRGMEQMGGCRPDNSIYLPFIRNAVGPMDYTPGAMISMQPEVYVSERPNSASIGTRAYQLALFVVFESGIQMLADNPSLYDQNHDCTSFISAVPTTWDETIALEAKVGEYVAVAKRKGNKWFIGAMSNDFPEGRKMDFKLDFLADHTTYNMTSFEDGPNADKQAMDYRKNIRKVDKNQIVSVQLSRNGGYAAIIEQEL